MTTKIRPPGNMAALAALKKDPGCSTATSQESSARQE